MSLLLSPLLLQRIGAQEASDKYEPYSYHLTPGGVPMTGAPTNNWNLNLNYAAATTHALYIPPGKTLFLSSLVAMVRGGGQRPDRWGSSVALTTGWVIDLVKNLGQPTEDVINLNAGLTFNSWGRFAARAKPPGELTLGAGDDYWFLSMPFGGADLPFIPKLRGGVDQLRATIGPGDNLSANTEVAWIASGLLF